MYAGNTATACGVNMKGCAVCNESEGLLQPQMHSTHESPFWFTPVGCWQLQPHPLAHPGMLLNSKPLSADLQSNVSPCRKYTLSYVCCCRHKPWLLAVGASDDALRVYDRRAVSSSSSSSFRASRAGPRVSYSCSVRAVAVAGCSRLRACVPCRSFAAHWTFVATFCSVAEGARWHMSSPAAQTLLNNFLFL
jgi:hypothetical protein